MLSVTNAHSTLGKDDRERGKEAVAKLDRDREKSRHLWLPAEFAHEVDVSVENVPAVRLGRLSDLTAKYSPNSKILSKML